MQDKRAEPDVSPHIKRLWRLSPGHQRGRPAELDVEQVVRTAMELADRDGLSGATLPKVAEALGFTKMSLYRYVGSKDELCELMGDLAIGPAPEVDEAAGWREALRRWTLTSRRVYGRHPWLAQLPITGPPVGPNAIGWMDALLRALRETGLGWPAKLGILNLLGGYVRTVSALEQQLTQGRLGSGLDQAQSERDYGAALSRLVEPDRFPEAAKLFASSVFRAPAEEGAEDEFGFGLGLILDGIEALIATEAGIRHGSP
ncbi:TetR/AcrR family transcriptional regulator [Nonomuraea sp. NPDC059023]|uniref:TetR/AcrR family transcriptional regulator n=1 Tax=unclassified Nonomuraea TaxID=2593643 RepID=UPI0036BC9FA8